MPFTISNKPEQEGQVVYFAGKVDSYRRELLNADSIMSPSNHGILIGSSKGRSVYYAGPTALSCDHGCWHSEPHGLVSLESPNGSENLDYDDCSCPVDPGMSRGAAVKRCMKQIQQADLIHAYIDSADCFGTLAELGYASALGKPIFLVFDWKFRAATPCFGVEQTLYTDDHGNQELTSIGEHDEFWFVKRLPGVVSIRYGGPKTIDPRVLEVTQA